jgi:uncharacterized membrane protein|tara:strand:- start:19144 stop:19758 length:615 start_codon:yes stop_codon:yes gene_type:complete
MAGILQSLNKTIIAGIALTILLLIIMSYSYGLSYDHTFWATISRYLHVLSGIMWIGLLWYFNFVQIPNMPNIPDEQKPAIGKVIAPAALFWFRWSALATLITGLTTLALYYGHQGAINTLLLTIPSGFDSPRNLTIGIGMWLAIIMAYNVWMVIWPNQKRALGIVEADAETKAKSARTAMLFSRTNTMLSIPMLLAMVAAQNLA